MQFGNETTTREGKPLIISAVPSRGERKMATGGRSQRRALLGEDDATLVFETSKGVEVVSTFDQMNLRDDLLRGIYAYGEAGGRCPICSVQAI